MYEALDSVTRRVLIHYTATLTCSPSGWWQSWLRPSGYHSPAAVGWSGFPAAPSSAGTIQQQQQQQDSVSVQPWEECQMVWVPSCLSTWSVVLKKNKIGNRKFISIIQCPHLYLHGLELLVAALCFGLHAPQFFLHGRTLLSHHSLHTSCFLLFNLQLLKQRSKRAYEEEQKKNNTTSII